MSQDIQLSSMNSLPMQDFGGSGGATPPGANPLAKFHKLLRGRYPIVIVLAILCGFAGGAAGWIIPKQQYASVGQIEISPLIHNYTDIDRIMPMFIPFMTTQQQILQSPRLIQAALKRDEWKATGKPTSADFVGFFVSNLVIDSPKASQLITITYTDTDQKVASAAVASLIGAYMTSQSDNELADITTKVQKYEGRKAAAIASIAVKQAEIQTLGQKYGSTELAVMQSARLQEMMALQGQIDQLQVNYDELINGNKAPTTQKSAPTPRITAEQLAQTNLYVRQLVHERNMAELDARELLLKLAPLHPKVLELQQRHKLFCDEIEEEISKYYAKSGTSPSVDALTNQATVNQFDPEAVRHQIEQLRAQQEAKRKVANDIGMTAAAIKTKTDEIQQQNNIINDSTKELDTLAFRKDMLGRVTIINGGEVASPASNKRPLIAAAGFMGGVAIPVGLMLLIGLMDSRLRYSDETDTDMSGITLLGILPNLPDRLSDPEQAATAAHCVHQIRTMLQINGAATEQSVFAVTSASPGDGKTSLTLALGLSFAACGSRTLLIDCDLIGAGLTRRLGINSETGILEAAANRSVLDNIRTTEITDVAILPVGSSGALHASTLSPNTLRRIIHEAKKHFDVILIDTGPILGSIEASLVATVADGIVLTVARGQQRQIVEKSLRHLMSIGAKIAGVVFNRAQARDFERSLSNVSMRSVGLIGTVDAANRYGVLGRAVQSNHKDSKK